MVSRLMFSLRKAVDRGTGPWTLSTMDDSSRRRSSNGPTLSFAPPGFDASHEISGVLTPPSEEVIELDSVARSPRDRGS